MELSRVLTLLLLAGIAASAPWTMQPRISRINGLRQEPQAGKQEAALQRRQAAQQFLTDKTSPFVVNGSALPEVDFDVGESYAGQLPIGEANPDSNLFFWFFPTTSEDPAAKEEIIIWLSGGPGCSSIASVLQQNGPILWQPGTRHATQNPWSWHRLANVVWIDQPVGTGFSTGTVTAENQEDVAEQFMGFWQKFAETFEVQNFKIFITGESYAGLYAPYIASRMLDEADPEHFDVGGLLLFSPLIAQMELYHLGDVQFMDHWRGLHPFNASFYESIHQAADMCGFDSYISKHLVYPPRCAQVPEEMPGLDADGLPIPECYSLPFAITSAAVSLNPCWNPYRITDTCPTPWDVLGSPGLDPYASVGEVAYFDRDDVKAALNAPVGTTWERCSTQEVFVDEFDDSAPSSISVLPRVIDATRNVILCHGDLDFVLPGMGTLLAIQNMTWAGTQGFQSGPSDVFSVPYRDPESQESLAGSGGLGIVHSEGGLSYVGLSLAGHFIPQTAPSAAFRQLEYLLGRVDNLTVADPFTVAPLSQ